MCQLLHFCYRPMPNTDFKLGDCSYLESCRHQETCKYVHYQVDPDDMQRLYFQLAKSTSFPEETDANSKKQWTEFQLF